MAPWLQGQATGLQGQVLNGPSPRWPQGQVTGLDGPSLQVRGLGHSRAAQPTGAYHPWPHSRPVCGIGLTHKRPSLGGSRLARATNRGWPVLHIAVGPCAKSPRPGLSPGREMTLPPPTFPLQNEGSLPLFRGARGGPKGGPFITRTESHSLSPALPIAHTFARVACLALSQLAPRWGRGVWGASSR